MEQWAAAADAEQRADGCQLCCLNIFPLSPYCWLTLSWGKLRPDFGRGRSLLPSMESWPSAGSRCPEHLLLARRGAGLTRGCRNTRSRDAAACARPGTPRPGHPQPWAPPALGTQCPGHPLPWVPNALGTQCPGHCIPSAHAPLHALHTCALAHACTHVCPTPLAMHALLQSRLGVWVHELLYIKAGAAGALDKCKQSLFFLKPWVAASACISSCYFLMTCSTMCRLGPG